MKIIPLLLLSMAMCSCSNSQQYKPEEINLKLPRITYSD
jgi:hypothetical protein